MMAMSLTEIMKRLAAERSGVAASEFALIVPVLILLLFGTAELGNALLLDKKITSAAQTGADLVAQQKSVSSGDITNIFTAMDSIISPYSSATASYNLASLVADEDGAVSIDWQKLRGGTAISEFSLPSGVVSKNNSVIVATVTYTYKPLFSDLITGSFTITDSAYLRPRTTTSVDFGS
jgi:Flp pilus assembly protein TadG